MIVVLNIHKPCSFDDGIPNLTFDCVKFFFEGSLPIIFGVKSIKEGINVIMLIDKMFALWNSILLEWEERRLLDGT
jgi:hypothetical protein